MLLVLIHTILLTLAFIDAQLQFPNTKCKRSAIQWPDDNKCHEIGTRGPCPHGHILVKLRNQIKCQPDMRYNNQLKNDSSQCDQFEVWWKETGLCEKLLVKGPCKEEEWLIIVNVSVYPQPACRYRPCQNGYIFWKKTATCYNASSASDVGICPNGHYIYNTPYGEGICNCKPGYFVWSDSGECFPGYRQGPCSNGSILVYNKYTNNVSCTINPCRTDGLARWKDGKCYPINARDPCLFDEEFGVDALTGELACVPTSIKQLIVAPALAALCNPGTFLTGYGVCKAAVTVTALTIFKLFG